MTQVPRNPMGPPRKIPAYLQSGHISAPVQKLRKLKALSEFEDVTLLTWLTKNEKMAISQPLSKN